MHGPYIFDKVAVTSYNNINLFEDYYASFCEYLAKNYFTEINSVKCSLPN